MEQKTLFAVAVMEQCLFKKIFKKITFIPFLHSHLLWNTVFVAKFYHWFNSIHFWFISITILKPK